MIRIAHISDIHLHKSTLEDAEKLVISPLLTDLDLFHNNLPIDFIFITGDLVDKGGISFGGVDKGLISFNDIFLTRMSKQLSLQPDQVYFVPGNHDIDRSADSPICESGILHTLTNVQSTNAFIKGGTLEGLGRVKSFKQFEASFHESHTSKEQSIYQSSYLSDRKSTAVGIVCLNSAWRCYDSEKDRTAIIIGEHQLQKGIEFTSKCDMRIALMHHPIDWLAEFDANAIQPLLQKHFQLVFCGHVHKNSSWQNASLFGNVFISVAPSNWITSARELNLAYCNGYTLLDIDPAALQVTVHHRRYSPTKGQYVGNNELGDNDGKRQFQLPTTAETKKTHDEFLIAANIKKIHFEALNERLLTYNTDSRAPKDLTALFVLPKIVQREEVDTEKEKKQKSLTLQEACSSGKHLMLLGLKEAGKTTLLDRLLVEFTENITKYRRIPILLDFSEFGNRRIETMIGRFLGVGISAAQDWMRDHKSVLLLDNLSLDSNSELSVQRLSKFLDEHPECQLIATVGQTLERMVPLELLANDKFNSIERFFIKPFGTKEIRELMEKWFAASETINNSEKVDHLVGVILALNLPRTPLAVSMFLWILEQQQNYQPINQAMMLENFIEKLFHKHSRKEIYSDQFGFKTKNDYCLKSHF